MITNKFLTYKVIHTILAILPTYLLTNHLSAAETINGFDLSDTLVPKEEILHGGPPHDGIPAIDKPHFVTIKKVNFLKQNDRIVGIDRNGIRKAYPVRILDYHEIVSIGAIFGIGVVTGKRDASVIRNILLSWLITLPIAMIF